MNFKQITFLIAVLLLFINCGNNKVAPAQETAVDNPISEDKTAVSSSSSIAAESIVGTWKLSLEVPDANENQVPDEDEIKKGFPNNYQLQLNADGSCRIQQVHTGRYEKVTEKGNDMLKVYRKKVAAEEDTDPLPDIYRIVSVKKEELVLQVIDGGMPSSFWFFKRIG